MFQSLKQHEIEQEQKSGKKLPFISPTLKKEPKTIVKEKVRRCIPRVARLNILFRAWETLPLHTLPYTPCLGALYVIRALASEARKLGASLVPALSPFRRFSVSPFRAAHSPCVLYSTCSVPRAQCAIATPRARSFSLLADLDVNSRYDVSIRL